MKLYFRLLWLLCRSPFKSKVEPLDTVISTWRVLPSDLDLYGHMNNGIYSMVMDLARLDFMFRIRLMSVVVKQRWQFPLGSTYVEFKSGLLPFEKFHVSTRICYWDDRWVYFHQDFYRPGQSERPATRAYAKAIFKDGNGNLSPRQVLAAFRQQVAGEPIVRPELSAELARALRL